MLKLKKQKFDRFPMNKKRKLLESMKLDIMMAEYLSAQKRTGIHPIQFSDQYGNTMTRMYDFDKGEFAQGSVNRTDIISKGVDALNNPKGVSVIVKEGRSDDLSGIMNYEEKGAVLDFEGDSVKKVAQTIDSLTDEELKAFIKKPLVSTFSAIADNMLEHIDTLLGDTPLGQIFPSRTDREILATSIEKAKKDLVATWNKKEGGGIIGVASKISEMIYNKATDVLPDQAAMFIESEEFKTAVANAVSYTNVGFGAMIGVGLAQSFTAMKGWEYIKKNNIKIPDKAIMEAKESIFKQYGKDTPKAKQALAKIDELAKNINLITPAQAGRAVLKQGLINSVKMIPALATVTLAATTTNQLIKYAKADESKQLQRAAEHINKEFDLLLKDIEGRPPYQVQQLIENYLKENNVTNLQEFMTQFALVVGSKYGSKYAELWLQNYKVPQSES